MATQPSKLETILFTRPCKCVVEVPVVLTLPDLQDWTNYKFIFSDTLRNLQYLSCLPIKDGDASNKNRSVCTRKECRQEMHQGQGYLYDATPAPNRL